MYVLMYHQTSRYQVFVTHHSVVFLCFVYKKLEKKEKKKIRKKEFHEQVILVRLIYYKYFRSMFYVPML